jgi:transcription factor E
MLDKFLKEVVVGVVGKPAEPIADLLNTNSYVNEFTLAKKLDLTINQTRNILYKLSDKGLVSSIRKKDKKKGWYTYFWKFEILKCLNFLKDLLLERKEEIKKDVFKRENSSFYVCKFCNLEFDEDKALLMDFTCDECGELLQVKDNSKLIQELEKTLQKIEDRLELINVEIEKELKKLERKKNLELKKEEREKQKKREEAKKKRELQKKKEGKTSKKKVIKKKVVKKKAVKKKIIKKKVTKKKVVKKKIAKKKVSKKVSKKKK